MIADFCGTWFRGPWNALETSSTHSFWSTPSEYPLPLSSSLVAPLCQCLVSCISVFLCRNSCNNILARGDKIQPPRYMHGPCSLVHLVQPYTTSLEPHNHLLRVCVRFVRPYLQDPKIIQWTTSTYHLDGIFLECCLDLYGVNPRMRNHHCLVQPLSTLRHVGCTTSPMSSNEQPGKKTSVNIHASHIITTINQNLFVTYLPSLRYMSPLSQSNHSTLYTWMSQPSTRSSKNNKLKSESKNK